MAEQAETGDPPFEGVRVVELAQWVFVPVAGALLADWGAEVVHIEPTAGDPYRGLATQGIGSERGGVNLSLALPIAASDPLPWTYAMKRAWLSCTSFWPRPTSS